jgi:Fic family protein
MTPEERLLRQVNEALDGTPYSFDDDEAGRNRVAVILAKVEQVQRSLVDLPDQDDYPREVRRILRTREVYESNAIEGAGLPLSETDRVLEQYPIGREPTQEFVAWVIHSAIAKDRRTYEVIGLEAARRLAADVASDWHRPLSEADIRSLHRIIMGEDPAAGLYKRYANEIAGSDHSPPLPVETPDHMRQLSEWIHGLPVRGYRTVGSIVRASAAHAWLAHIHPFEDGNGRLARLIANILLSREGMPPLILRSKGDRAKYIDALGASDEAGDLSRLILVIASAIERVTRQMSDPAQAVRLFELDVDRRKQGAFTYWESEFRRWAGSVRAELLLLSMQSDELGFLDPSDFANLRNRESVSRAWFLEVRRDQQVQGMWYFGYPSMVLYRLLERDQVYPVLRYSIKQSAPSAPKPFRPFIPNDGSYAEFMLEPNEQCVYVSDGHARTARLDLDVASRFMAAISHEHAPDG